MIFCCCLYQDQAVTGMEWKLRRCCTSTTLLRPSCVDRLTNLPDELLGQILSRLTTKDVVAMQALSKRMRKALDWITSVDLDDSPVSLCLDRPLLNERFSLFKSFVTNVVQHLQQSNQSLTRFRLRFGGDKNTLDVQALKLHHCEKACLPHLEPALLNAWISYPLTHYGLRELDLSFHLRDNPFDSKLPPALFASQSLEVLKLDSNIVIDDCAHIPLISLPKLKLLNLHSVRFTEDDFVTRLVLSCPSLEDLSMTNCSWEKSDHLTIYSRSLQSLVLDNIKIDEEKNSNLVLLDTPNLQKLDYADNLSFRYSVPHLNALVEACIDIVGYLQTSSLESPFRSQLGLLKSLCDVQHLSLLGIFPENMDVADEAFKVQLPVFRNLRTLRLSPVCSSRWDIVLLPILNSSPLLETLFFPEGLFSSVYGIYFGRPHPNDVKAAALEADGWRRAETVFSCCLTHLKRIELGRCYGIDRELSMIKFLMGKAPALRELSISLICMSERIYAPAGTQVYPPNLEEFERRVKELPRASKSCSIKILR